MTLYPSFIVRIARKAQKFSNWIDETFFPLPATEQERKLKLQRDIEQSAYDVERQIEKCKRLSECYDLYEMISTFRHTWGDSIQVKSWADSLMLKLHTKESKIIFDL